MNLFTTGASPSGPPPVVARGGLRRGPDPTVEPPLGDDGFAEFYGRYRRPLVEALGMTLGDIHLAAEAADEALARAYERWAKVATFDMPEGWVYTVGLNWARSFLRRRRRVPQPFGPQFVELAPAGEPTLVEALKALDLDQRAVIVCRFYLGLSETETADTLGIRPGTVKSRQHRGLQHLSRRLDHLRPEETR
jgi:RNA polymerase sigma-70 factor (ECF subfamily)